MFGRLDATSFSGSPDFYQGEFEIILAKVTACYHLMLSDNVQVPNDENVIRDKLLIDYLRNPKVLRQVKMPEVLFDRETLEDHSVGRTDIRIISPNTFKEPKAYYIIECKKLDNVNTTGITGLNAEYIRNGIVRFTSNYYSSYHRVNGMIGFIVKPLDIHKNTACINTLLEKSFPEANTKRKIVRENFIEDFEFHYSSSHTDTDNMELDIYHLMLDFSGKMKS